jgi:hypothetical protein
MKINSSVLLIGLVLATTALSKPLDLSEITRIRNEISQYVKKSGNVERKLAVVSMNQSGSPALNNRPVDRYLKPMKPSRDLKDISLESASLTQQPVKETKREGRILAQSFNAPAPRMLKDKTSKSDKIIVTYVPAKPKASKKLTSFMQKSNDRKLKLQEPDLKKEGRGGSGKGVRSARSFKAKKSKKVTKAKKAKNANKNKGRHLSQTPEPRNLMDYHNTYPQKRSQNSYPRNYGGKFYKV